MQWSKYSFYSFLDTIMKLNFLLTHSVLILAIILSTGESQNLQKLNSLDPSDIAEISSALARGESRQMGILGFAALGVMMFPILVSLGMASFVSHLPTVFKEFATEFGIPSTPPRRFFLFRRKRSDFDVAYEDRWKKVLKTFNSKLDKNLGKKDFYRKNKKKPSY